METFIHFLTNWGYVGLFIGAFIAGSVFPFSSEAILIGCIGPLKLSPLLCFLSASSGNILGGVTCYWLGRLGNLKWIEQIAHVKADKLHKAEHFVQEGGAWMGFFAFIPILGSAISITLGLMKANPWIFSIAMGIGKMLRYAIVIWGTLKATSIL